jgi:alkylation response protein AidB-like acyl-CoA dehydrogenase
MESLETVIKEVIEPSAVVVDSDAAFPREAVKALGAAGLLGLTSAETVGGMGLGLAEAAQVVEKTSNSCVSTAMILTMHYCADALIERFGNEGVRREIAAGRHLSTLAWSEAGSRSHFWAPLGTARRDGDEYALECVKSWVTSAMEADSYIWS